jgi:hypothetical protein
LPPLEFCFGTRPIQAARSRPGLEGLRVGYTGDQRRCDKRADAGKAVEPPTGLGGAVPSKDPAVSFENLTLDQMQLGDEGPKARAGDLGNAAVLARVQDPVPSPLRLGVTLSRDHNIGAASPARSFHVLSMQAWEIGNVRHFVVRGGRLLRNGSDCYRSSSLAVSRSSERH